MDNKNDIEMRKLLVSISSRIGPEDLKTMKFFCKEIIPAKHREEIETAVDLFEKLEERGKLKPDDMSFLELLLENTCAGRTDLVEILHKYKNGDRANRNTTFSNGVKYESVPREESAANEEGVSEREDLSSIFYFLANNLGRDYLMVLRRLRVPDSILDQLVEVHPRNVKEVTHQAFKYWYQSNYETASQEKIIQALQAEKRYDLASKISQKDI